MAGPRAALLAGLYAAFSPPFLTRYSLSNDGNYVEVLALGTWALWLAARWTREGGSRGPHGSSFRPILTERYETADNTPESYDHYALCYRCHSGTTF